MTREQANAEIRSVPRLCRGRLSPSASAKKQEAIDAGDLELAAQHDTAGRRWCGADVNEIIIADGRFDGDDHHYTCPDCGRAGVFAVLFELEG